ncbi:hypothetical protein HGQ17_07680 [Nesterenkonia sp. MY13]|uniref:Calcineurin-like phosphoesterase domain-containing protein n=1 Tax=Nesterenkonia sedimenti TaxID=1463632 RepID=A0A7X8TKW3_9MICC|nr:metallophosphoesterase [Nesterenkonia sedimenti]NLS09883.1 hypothetical protein [Nesterenkonia sedimenti]
MTTLALISDLHIGAPVKGLGLPAEQARAEAYQAIASMQDEVLGSGADAVLCAGDIFDRHDHSEQALQIAEDLFAGFDAAGLPAALIGGNHDVESPLTARLRLPDSAQWVGQGELGLEGPGTVVWEQWRIAVHGQAVRDKDELRDLAAGYPKPVEGMWNLGLLHTSLTGQWSNRSCAPTTLETLYAAGYDSWILGHVHQPMVMASRPLIAYPGSVHTHKAGEPGGEGFALLHLENHTNPRIEFRRLPVVTA